MHISHLRRVKTPSLLAMLDIGRFTLFAIAKLAVVAIWIGLFVFVDRLELNQPYVEVVPIVW